MPAIKSLDGSLKNQNACDASERSQFMQKAFAPAATTTFFIQRPTSYMQEEKKAT